MTCVLWIVSLLVCYTWSRHLPRSNSQNLQLSECPPCAESMEQNGFRDTKDSIPRAMPVKYHPVFWLEIFPHCISPGTTTDFKFLCKTVRLTVKSNNNSAVTMLLKFHSEKVWSPVWGEKKSNAALESRMFSLSLFVCPSLPPPSSLVSGLLWGYWAKLHCASPVPKGCL